MDTLENCFTVCLLIFSFLSTLSSSLNPGAGHLSRSSCMFTISFPFGNIFLGTILRAFFLLLPDFPTTNINFQFASSLSCSDYWLWILVTPLAPFLWTKKYDKHDSRYWYSPSFPETPWASLWSLQDYEISQSLSKLFVYFLTTVPGLCPLNVVPLIPC